MHFCIPTSTSKSHNNHASLITSHSCRLSRTRSQWRRHPRLRHLLPQRRRTRRTPSNANGHRLLQTPIPRHQHRHLVRHQQPRSRAPLRKRSIPPIRRTHPPNVDALHRRPARGMGRAPRGSLAQRTVCRLHVAHGERRPRIDQVAHSKVCLLSGNVRRRGSARVGQSDRGVGAHARSARVGQSDRGVGAHARGWDVLGAAEGALHGIGAGARSIRRKDEILHAGD